MAVYCFGCLLSMFMTGFVLRVKHKNEGWKYLLTISFFASLPLMVIASIRYYVGQDYSSYIRLFRQAINGYRQPGLEIPFHGLNQLIHALGGDYTWVFAICAIVFCMFVFAHIFEESPYPWLSVFLLVTAGYYFSFFNTMRQLVGCAILMYSIRYIKRRHPFRFGLCIAFACCFHYASLLFIVVYFLYGKTIRRRTLFAITIAVFLLATPLSRLILQIASWTPYAHYIGGFFDNSKRGYITLLINVVQVLFATVYYDDEDKDFCFYYNLQLIALWLTAFVGKVVLISRIRWMFSMPSIILLPLIVSKVEKKHDRMIIITIMVLLYAVYFYYTIGINNSSNVLPYQTVFSR